MKDGIICIQKCNMEEQKLALIYKFHNYVKNNDADQMRTQSITYSHPTSLGMPGAMCQQSNEDYPLKLVPQKFQDCFVKLVQLDSFCLNLPQTTVKVQTVDNCCKKEFDNRFSLNGNYTNVKPSTKKEMIKLEKVDIKEEPFEQSEEYIEASYLLNYEEKWPFETVYVKDVPTDLMNLKSSKYPETPITDLYDPFEHQGASEKCEAYGNHCIDNLDSIDQKRYKQSQRELKRLKSHALGPKMAICDTEKDFCAKENSRVKRRNIPFPNYSQMLKLELPKETRKRSMKKYNVEKIIDKRITSFGRSEYLVKWEGYADKSNTWEPPSSFEDLSLIFEFEKSRDIEKRGKSLCVMESFKMEEKSKPENFAVQQQLNILYENSEFWKGHLLKKENGNSNYKKYMTCKKFTTRGGLSKNLKQMHDLTIIKNEKSINIINITPQVDMSVDETKVAINILKYLETMYVAKCEYCKIYVLFRSLNEHILLVHADETVTCYCGFNGELHSILAHSYKKFHIPNENRPLILSSSGSQSEIIFIPKLKPQKIGTFPCHKCFKTFAKEKSRKLHYNVCKLEKNFPCEICLEKFAFPSHLQKHKEWKHEFRRCELCERTFKSQITFSQHVFHMHENILRKSNKHLRIDSESSLSIEENLNTQIDHSVPIEKDDIIELLILTESDLDTSSSDDDLKELTHSNEKKCTKCGDTFNTFQQLKVHTRMHTRELPHACQHCSQKFISQNLLMKHKLKCHKEFLSEGEILRKAKRRTSVSSDSSDSDDSSIQ